LKKETIRDTNLPHNLLQGDNRAAKVRVIERISTFEDCAPFAGFRD
jgi:hypothetical protein